MRCERIQAEADPALTAGAIRSLAPSAESVSAAVAEIIARVRAGGDEAVRVFTTTFDTGGAEPKPLRADPLELAEAADRLDAATRAGLELAIENVRAVAQATVDSGREAGRAVELGTHTVRVGEVPVRSAAVYVPGGRAPYPSTVVMGAIPAQVARVEEIAVCSPPGADGDLHRAVLAACHLVGASTVYRMGGAQAIAALAYGTETIAPVDVIVGPGNLYVQEAKRQVSGRVGIDGFAGPSDLMVVAGSGADAEPLALDLLAQAEHGPGTLVVGVSASRELLDALGGRLDSAPDTGAVACLVVVRDAEAGLALAEAFAPEHLQLVGHDAEALADRVTRAGCVFVGAAAGTAFGDYVAGSNHILPTAGAARFASGLTPERFQRSTTEVRISDPDALARAAAPVARSEGFELHARSMEARIRDNQPT
jgi:histidinol dehydrogenase